MNPEYLRHLRDRLNSKDGELTAVEVRETLVELLDQVQQIEDRIA